MRRARRWSAVVVLLALVVAACGSSSGKKAGSHLTGVPGVTDTEIRFAVIGTKANNPLGTCILDCYAAGVKAYFAFRNAQGGIYGRKLTVSETLDDELTKNQQRALEVVSANNVFGDFNATLFASGWGDLSKAGIPSFTWGINFAESEGKTNIFPSLAQACGTCTGRLVPWTAQHVHAKRAATLGYGVTQNSRDCAHATAASFQKYQANTGVQLVYTNDNIAFGMPNGIGPEVTAMKKANVDFISTCFDLNGMKTLAQELDRQGMHNVVLYHPNTYNQAFVKAAGKLFEGNIVSVQFRPFEAETKGTAAADFLTWMKKTNQEVSELAMVGWIDATIAYDGLKGAGASFTRAKVVAALNAMTDYTAGGLINPVDWGRQHVAPTQEDPYTHGFKQECAAQVKIVNGAFQMIGPKDKPWICFSNKTRDWAEPQYMNFK